MHRNAFTPFIAPAPKRSGVDEMVSLLCEVAAWRLRMIELLLACLIFFWLGFMIAARCL